MPQPTPSSPPLPEGPNKTIHYVGLVIIVLTIIVIIMLI